MRSRKDVHLIVGGHQLAGHRVHGGQGVDFVAEELHPDGIGLVHREDLEGVTTHPKGAAGAREVIPHVLHFNQFVQQVVASPLLPDSQLEHRVNVFLRRAEAVDGRDRRNHDDVAPGQQGVGGRIAKPLDFLVEAGILLDEGVGLWYVGLGLVVVVVADEVLDRIGREELPQLGRILGGQRLVRLHHQHRTLQPLSQPGDRRRLAGAGRAEQDDVVLPRPHPAFEFGYCGRLVAGGLEFGLHLERCNPPRYLFDWAHASSVGRRTDRLTFLVRSLGLCCASATKAAPPAPQVRHGCRSWSPPNRRPPVARHGWPGRPAWPEPVPD